MNAHCRPAQLAELPRSEFNPELFSHIAYIKFLCDIRDKIAVFNVLRQNMTIFLCRKWIQRGEIKRKWGKVISLFFLILSQILILSPFLLYFLILSPFLRSQPWCSWCTRSITPVDPLLLTIYQPYLENHFFEFVFLFLNTKQDQALPSHVHGKIWSHGTKFFWSTAASVTFLFWDTL